MWRDFEVDEDAEACWQEEIYCRLQQIDSRAVTLIPWDEVQFRLRARLADRNPTGKG